MNKGWKDYESLINDYNLKEKYHTKYDKYEYDKYKYDKYKYDKYEYDKYKYDKYEYDKYEYDYKYNEYINKKIIEEILEERKRESEREREIWEKWKPLEKTDEEKLEEMDIKVIEAFLRKKKLNALKNKNNK
jgi:hypothetical protein